MTGMREAARRAAEATVLAAAGAGERIASLLDPFIDLLHGLLTSEEVNS